MSNTGGRVTKSGSGSSSAPKIARKDMAAHLAQRNSAIQQQLRDQNAASLAAAPSDTSSRPASEQSQSPTMHPKTAKLMEQYRTNACQQCRSWSKTTGNFPTCKGQNSMQPSCNIWKDMSPVEAANTATSQAPEASVQAHGTWQAPSFPATSPTAPLVDPSEQEPEGSYTWRSYPHPEIDTQEYLRSMMKHWDGTEGQG